MTISIAPITVDTIDEYHHVLGAVARERKYLAREDAPPIERSRAFVLENMERGNPHFVALDGVSVVGWCDVRRNTEFNALHAGMLGMGMLADYRGKGIGSRLMEAALAAAWSIGLTRIELSVNASNQRAIRLYEKSGFEYEGVLRNAIMLAGDYQDVVIMGILAEPRLC